MSCPLPSDEFRQLARSRLRSEFTRFQQAGKGDLGNPDEKETAIYGKSMNSIEYTRSIAKIMNAINSHAGVNVVPQEVRIAFDISARRRELANVSSEEIEPHPPLLDAVIAECRQLSDRVLLVRDVIDQTHFALRVQYSIIPIVIFKISYDYPGRIEVLTNEMKSDQWNNLSRAVEENMGKKEHFRIAECTNDFIASVNQYFDHDGGSRPVVAVDGRSFSELLEEFLKNE